jgi:hypothetical protein
MNLKLLYWRKYGNVDCRYLVQGKVKPACFDHKITGDISSQYPA